MGLSVEPRTCACGWQGECDDGEAEDDQKGTLRELWEVSPSCLRPDKVDTDAVNPCGNSGNAPNPSGDLNR